MKAIAKIIRTTALTGAILAGLSACSGDGSKKNGPPAKKPARPVTVVTSQDRAELASRSKFAERLTSGLERARQVSNETDADFVTTFSLYEEFDLLSAKARAIKGLSKDELNARVEELKPKADLWKQLNVKMRLHSNSVSSGKEELLAAISERRLQCQELSIAGETCAQHLAEFEIATAISHEKDVERNKALCQQLKADAINSKACRTALLYLNTRLKFRAYKHQLMEFHKMHTDFIMSYYDLKNIAQSKR